MPIELARWVFSCLHAGWYDRCDSAPQHKEFFMMEAALLVPVAAAGWALIGTWVMGGGIGMFLLLFVILKMLGK